MSTASYTPASVMVIAAHPDDIEFGPAGTIARWIAEGCRATYVLITSGDVGIADAGMTKARATEIREDEQTEAARITGVEEVVFLREPDGMLQPTLALRKKLVREIRRVRPEVVVTNDPTIYFVNGSYINHPDHRAAATAALDAVFPAAGQPNLFEELAEEGLRAHKVRKVYISWTQDADTWVNVSDSIDTKIAALRAHASQMRDWDPEPMIRKWSAETAKGKEMEYAESFKVVTLESDEDWEKRRGRVADAHDVPAA
jgi:LmbE family N-acetylglucosaminyl deacetylase